MEIKKNFDGIQNQPRAIPQKKDAVVRQRFIKIDSVTKGGKVSAGVKPARSVFRPPRVLSSHVPTWKLRFLKAAARQKVSLLVAVVALFLAFGGGMWFVLGASNSRADSAAPAVLGAQTDHPSQPIILSGAQVPPVNSVSNDVLFNTPIQYLKQYLQDVSEPDIIAKRSQQIREYLEQRNSPLASAAETIAVQPHWNIIIAVAFAESSLGKNCIDYNCSNIGSRPGASSWHRYSSYNAWVVDFNRLLDEKYNDWTLQQMCGVYVKPCNPNWLLATQQVLNEIQAEHIE